MSNRQVTQNSGSVFDTAVAPTDQKFLMGQIPSLGDKREFDDGRKFVFVQSDVDIAAGGTIGVKTALATEIANKCTAAAIGATEITVDTTTYQFFGGAAGVLAKNALADGYLATTDGTGESYLYRIKSHTAGTATVSVTFTLYDPLKVAIAIDTDINLVGNIYRDVAVGTATLKCLGVAVVAVTATSDSEDQYFWAQYNGPACCLGVTTIGIPCAADAGVVKVATAATEQIVGVALSTDTDGNGVVYLAGLL